MRVRLRAQGYEKPEVFDPDRFGPERQEDVKCASNYLVFGHGPHQCVGKEYAYNQLTCFVARLASSVDLQRVKSKVSAHAEPLGSGLGLACASRRRHACAAWH